MAVPASADDKEYDKLNAVIDRFQPERVWFLGDLFHSYQNTEWHFFEQWVNCQTPEIALVMGNHDVISRDHFHHLGMKTYDRIQMGEVYLTHHPEEVDGFFNIAGHVHPSVKLTGGGFQKVKLPCFFQTESGMILPAFGDFTGTYTIKPKKGNKVYVCVDDQVIQVG